MSKETPVTDHIGFKYLHLIIASLLVLVALFYKFGSWLVGPVDFLSLGFIYLGLLVFMLISFMNQLAWHFFAKYIKLVYEGYKPVGFKTLVLFGVTILQLFWTIYNYFIWLPATTVTPEMLVTFWQGLVVLFAIGIIGIFLYQVIWAVAHRVSDK